MARKTKMQQAARWHIWLGWAAAIPLLLWTISGLIMVIRPLDEVRGEDLRLKKPAQTFEPGQVILPSGFDQPVKSLTITAEPDGLVTRAELADGSIARSDAAGRPLRDFNEPAARDLVRKSIAGGDRVASVTFYPADRVPFDFRRAMPVWQVVLDGGTRVYVGKESGRIEGVRTPFWRFYDFMWGLHIMDPVERENTHHPVIIVSVLAALASCIFGTVLLFRRRKARRA